MRRWLFFVVPFALVSTVGIGVIAYFWVVGWPCESYTPVDFFDLDPRTRCVRTRGSAHYEVVLDTKIAGNGFFADQHYYVFGLFPPGNNQEREIRVLVRTERPPERMVSFEEMEIEGRLIPMDYRKIPFDAETQMGRRSNYYFSDRIYLLEPDRILVSGEPDWVRTPK